MCALGPACPNCAAGFHFSFICCSSREQIMWPSIWHRARGSKMQLHWWFTTKNVDSLTTQPSWWQSALTHWHMRFYQLTIVYFVISEEFTLSPCMTMILSQVLPQSFLEIKVAAWCFTDTVRTHRWGRMAKNSTFSLGFLSEACSAFASSFPQKIKSASLDKVSYDSAVLLNSSQAFEVRHRSCFITNLYLLELLQI